MQFPNPSALAGLWASLNASSATPLQTPFTEQNMRDIQEAITWLNKEEMKLLIQQRTRAATKAKKKPK